MNNITKNITMTPTTKITEQNIIETLKNMLLSLGIFVNDDDHVGSIISSIADNDDSTSKKLVLILENFKHRSWASINAKKAIDVYNDLSYLDDQKRYVDALSRESKRIIVERNGIVPTPTKSIEETTQEIARTIAKQKEDLMINRVTDALWLFNEIQTEPLLIMEWHTTNTILLKLLYPFMDTNDIDVDTTVFLMKEYLSQFGY